ncbi:hypothetical protein [Amycolatopsis nigrescens]|uniref:hypothetical protein n=1 Tax=Amycolatopsis nigrescens TaxID=381445 RepID=UPI0012F75F4C|nr:hypothetical protein [Amycolatopsis nigrescens]
MLDDAKYVRNEAPAPQRVVAVFHGEWRVTYRAVHPETGRPEVRHGIVDGAGETDPATGTVWLPLVAVHPARERRSWVRYDDIVEIAPRQQERRGTDSRAADCRSRPVS